MNEHQRIYLKANEDKIWNIITIVIVFLWIGFVIHCTAFMFEGISGAEIAGIFPAFIILSPVLYFIMALLHRSFYSGVVSKKDKDNKPKSHWL